MLSLMLFEVCDSQVANTGIDIVFGSGAYPIDIKQ